MRATTFACLLRQDVAYFDRTENNVGAICNRLSSDAIAIQKMTGARLGVVCETLAMFIFAIILGMMVNRPITLILIASLSIFVILAYIYMKLNNWCTARCRYLVDQASSVRRIRPLDLKNLPSAFSWPKKLFTT